MPEQQNADVKPRKAGETENPIPADRDTASVGVRPPNEPGLTDRGNKTTGEPSVEPADEVSEGR